MNYKEHLFYIFWIIIGLMYLGTPFVCGAMAIRSLYKKEPLLATLAWLCLAVFTYAIVNQF